MREFEKEIKIKNKQYSLVNDVSDQWNQAEMLCIIANELHKIRVILEEKKHE